MQKLATYFIKIYSKESCSRRSYGNYAFKGYQLTEEDYRAKDLKLGISH